MIMKDCFFKYPFALGARDAVSPVLSRYLPKINQGVVKEIIAKVFPPSSWIVDIFGSSPSMVHEAAGMGYKVLMLYNNPLIGLIAQLPILKITREEIDQHIEILAQSRVREDRVESHILHLYESQCSHCGSPVTVSEFLWDNSEEKPIQKTYHCYDCEKGFTDPTTPPDIEKAMSYRDAKIHRARSLSRTISPDDRRRRLVEQVLSAYTDRTLYALNILLDFYESLELDPRQKKIFALLFLELFDRVSKLWKPNFPTHQPRRIAIPNLYLERNVWHELLNIGENFNYANGEVEVTVYPNLPRSNGICLVYRKHANIKNIFKKIEIKGIVTSFPRINQAFWEFSAIWSVWLLGKIGREYFKGVTVRQAYSWQWYINAIVKYLSVIRSALSDETTIINIQAENEPEFTLSTLIASINAELYLDGIAYREDDNQVQYYFKALSKTHNHVKSREEINSLYTEILAKYNQPIDYSRASTIIAPIIIDNLKGTTELNSIKGGIDSFLASHPSRLFLAKNMERIKDDYWWSHDSDVMMWHDRVENFIYNLLKEESSFKYESMEKRVLNQFPGILSPAREYIKLCLFSYATDNKNSSDRWSIKVQDKPENRDKEVSRFVRFLQTKDDLISFVVRSIPNTNGNNVIFIYRENNPIGLIFIKYTANITDVLTQFQELSVPRYVIIPGSRANLVAYKSQTNPAIDALINQKQVTFIKFRQFRRLFAKSQITMDDLHEIALLDPITYDRNQMRLF